MNLSLSMDKGVAESYCNTVRRLAFSVGESWRPIAMKLDTPFDLITASSNIVEDTYRIISNLTSIVFAHKDVKTTKDYVVETYEFQNQLILGGDVNSVFNFSRYSGPLITVLGDDTVKLTVVYRKSSGEKDTDDNRNYLQSIGEDPRTYRCLNSRHTDLMRFDYNVEDQYCTDLVNLNIVSSTGNEREIMDEVIKVLESTTNMLKSVTS